MKQNKNKLLKLMMSNDFIVTYHDNFITRTQPTGIFVWELRGPDMSDFVAWEQIDWNEFTIYKKIKNPFKH